MRRSHEEVDELSLVAVPATGPVDQPPEFWCDRTGCYEPATARTAGHLLDQRHPRMYWCGRHRQEQDELLPERLRLHVADWPAERVHDAVHRWRRDRAVLFEQARRARPDLPEARLITAALEALRAAEGEKDVPRQLGLLLQARVKIDEAMRVIANY